VSDNKDSRTLAKEVRIRKGKSNNSPAEWTGPENGWRYTVSPMPDRSGIYARTSRWAHWLHRSVGVNRHGAASGADLGGSINYSNKNFED